MCTVTFIPVNNKYYLTSNRDEKHVRKRAVPPKEYVRNGIRLIYPKDAEAEGTWIALKDNGDAAVLLNGAFKKHIAAPPYRKSRGLIFLDIFNDDNPVTKFTKTSFNNIEPFTLVLFFENNLYECRWDGHKKYGRQLQNDVPHIWSSATLYDEEVVSKRELWLAKWLAKNNAPEQDDVFNFHRFAGDGDSNNDVKMNRDGIYATVSITGIELTGEKGIMHYLDLKANQSFIKQIELSSFSVA